MKTEKFEVGERPAILWGESAEKLYLYIHGMGGCKEEAQLFAEKVCPLGYQVLSIDLPQHGERKGCAAAFEPWDVLPELRFVIKYAKAHFERISLFANSIGAWFSMLTFADEKLENCLFLSPVLDMNRLIEQMMGWAGVSIERLQAEQEIATNFGQTLSWRYRQFALDNAITRWDFPTAILYGSSDHLVERETVNGFCERFGCGLTVLEGGEHWFHTDEQLKFMQDWIEKSI